MEKDYFKDRTVETTQINKIKEGDYVYICLKAMQPYAKEIDDLTFGKVTKILTKHNHPRGIKVSIKSYNNPNINRTINNLIPITEEEHLIGFNQIGRVVYTTKDGIIQRNKKHLKSN